MVDSNELLNFQDEANWTKILVIIDAIDANDFFVLCYAKFFLIFITILRVAGNNFV